MLTDPHSVKSQAETALVDNHFDFIAKYHAIADLRHLARTTPHRLDERTIGALGILLRSDRFRRVRQRYFLFREAAAVMRDMAKAADGSPMGPAALAALATLLGQVHGSAHRGVAEALGSLPVSIRGPALPDGRHGPPPTMGWDDLLAANGLRPAAASYRIGRSVVTPLSRSDRLLVVKLAREGDRVADLSREILWMQALRQPEFTVACRFHIPRPLTVDCQSLLRLRSLPLPPPEGAARFPRDLAIAFVAHRDYFVYPNQRHIDGTAALEMLGRNAFLMGRLASMGVIHDAPIPLFHNRTQRMRRDDQGRYQWFRAGRLDQWLDSCAFPNLGLSGLRDFEHLASFTGDSRHLYRHIGSHFLSLLLVAGSHFRCRDKGRRGLDDNGAPQDTRDLFDRSLLAAMIRDIFGRYYAGFTGTAAPRRLPLDEDRLVDRMIDEMGVDRHMTELLRRVDQQQMSDAQFADFLAQRGYGVSRRERCRRGEKDMRFVSGPHLGDFNRPISLPELIEAVAAMSAVCIAGRFTVDGAPDAR